MTHPNYYWAFIRDNAKDAGGPNDLSHVQLCEDDYIALENIEYACNRLRELFDAQQRARARAILKQADHDEAG